MMAVRPPRPVAAAAKPRVKIMPSRVTGKVLEWKGKHGWIQPDQPISHPQAQMHRGKVFLGQGDVEAEIDGIGARVSFFVYADGTGLGAMNCRPAGAEVQKTVIKPLHQQQPRPGMQQPGMLRPQAAKAATGPQLVTAVRPRAVVPPGKAGAAGVRPVVTPTKLGTVAPTKLGAAVAVAPTKLGAAVAPTKLGAKAAGKGAAKGPGPRRRVNDDALTGTVKAWKGGFGWITPDEPIEHGLFKGTVYLSAADCEDKESMAEGVQVAFYLYTDSQGLGAECCAIGAEPAEGMARSPAVGAASSDASEAAAAPTPVMVPTKQSKGALPVLKPAGAQGSVTQILKPAGVTPVQRQMTGIKRKRITELEVMGEVTEWKGTFGWITPQDPIEHEQATKNEGRVKVISKDIVGDEKKLEEGQLVQFHVYVDGSGLGAEECLPF